MPTCRIGSPDDTDHLAEALGPVSLWVSRYYLPAHRRRVIT